MLDDAGAIGLRDLDHVNPDFVEDRPSDGTGGFLKRLEPEERDALYDLVDTEIRGEVQQELYSQYGAELEILRAMMAPLKQGLEKAVEDELHVIAQGAVELAVAIGQRLARAHIEVDETHMVRCLEELVSRTQIGAELTVIAHPREIQKLQSCRDELRDLNVVNLVPEKALEIGGCIVQSAGQEWDLTFRGQGDALAEMVREAMLYGKDTGEGINVELPPRQSSATAEAAEEPVDAESAQEADDEEAVDTSEFVLDSPEVTS